MKPDEWLRVQFDYISIRVWFYVTLTIYDSTLSLCTWKCRRERTPRCVAHKASRPIVIVLLVHTYNLTVLQTGWLADWLRITNIPCKTWCAFINIRYNPNLTCLQLLKLCTTRCFHGQHPPHFCNKYYYYFEGDVKCAKTRWLLPPSANYNENVYV